MPSLPRTNEVIQTVKLFGKIAVTLDGSKSELTSWTYQHAASIESTRLFRDHITINDFAITSSKLDSEIIFVLVLTSNRWIEIYEAKSLNKETLFNLQLHSPARVHSTHSGTFFVLTNNGLAYSIAQQITSENEIQFNQTANIQLKIPCSKMFTSVLTLNSLENLIIFADNGQSMAIWTIERIIYIDVDVSPYLLSSQLKSIDSERTENLLLMYFDDKNLLSCQVNLEESIDRGSLQMTPFDKADKFCLKNDCLATYNNGNTQLNLHNIRSRTCYEPIQLENECLQLCLNESASYVFALVKPRVLFMYRINDRRQLAKLFVYDFVSFMVADNEFLVLAMNDRRLLTLMIADPDDPNIQAKIQALPSRNPRRVTKSAVANLIEHMEKCTNMSSSDEESDFAANKSEDDSNTKSNNDGKAIIQKNQRPISLLRFVTRLDGRHLLSKMSSDAELQSKALTLFSEDSESFDMAQIIYDSDNENHNDDHDVEYPGAVTTAMTEQQPIEHDLDDIRQKTLEHNRQQLKGIQFANAGDGNLKVVNSYAVTSNTCTLI
ncbi:unnamed protein product [Rotaria sp. Silwood1]|nr:unnamed protein product [Rotaria sp. Silwood1]